jgi:hypothetical protein
MQRFMLLYVGPATPPDASHEGWPEWFDKLGDRVVDRGLRWPTGVCRTPWVDRRHRNARQWQQGGKRDGGRPAPVSGLSAMRFGHAVTGSALCLNTLPFAHGVPTAGSR